MARGPAGFGQSGRRSDLVAQMRMEARGRKFRMVYRAVVFAIVMSALAVAGKLAIDVRNVGQAVTSTRAELAHGGSQALARAAADIQHGLSIRPDHDEIKLLDTLVRAQMQLDRGDVRADAPIDIEIPVGTHTELVVARGLVALARHDYGEASNACNEARSRTHESTVAPDHGAWLCGLVALGRPYDPLGMEQAIMTLSQATALVQAFTEYDRTLSALLLRAGRPDAAVEALGQARIHGSNHAGIAVDEAVVDAVMQRNSKRVVESMSKLLHDPSVLAMRDRARAQLAIGSAWLHEGDREHGLAALEQGWSIAPTWDQDTCDVLLEGMIRAGHARAKELVAQATLAATEAQAAAAWLRMSEGAYLDALTLLAALPQDHARVGYLQALALTEQQRWAEALPWIDRSERMWPGRVELAVARARAELRVANASAATTRLEALVAEHPHAPRVHTGLAEAYLASDDPDTRAKAKRVLRLAIERELIASEASLLLAELEYAAVKNTPGAIEQVLALFEQAAQKNPHVSRYPARLAQLMAELGLPERAHDVLLPIAERADVDATSLLVLVRAALVQEEPLSRKRTQTLEAWLAKARSHGGAVIDLEREHARLEIASGKASALASARARLEAIITNKPDDIEARVMHGNLLMRLGDTATAELIVKFALDQLPKHLRGRLYVLLARIEENLGRKRDAAAHVWQGWAQLVKNGSASDLLEAAAPAMRLWHAIQQPSGVRSIARDLSERLPYHPKAWLLRGQVQLDEGYIDHACASADKTIALDPKDPGGQALRGECLARRGDRAGAKLAYQEAVKLARSREEQTGYRKLLDHL